MDILPLWKWLCYLSTCQVKKVSIDASRLGLSQSIADLIINLIYNLVQFIITGPAADEGDRKFSMCPKQFDQKSSEGDNFFLITGHIDHPGAKDGDSQLFKSCNPAQNIVHSTTVVNDPAIGRRDALRDSVKTSRFLEGSQLVSSKPSNELNLDIDDLDIPWNDLVLKERIGAGSSLPFLLDKRFCVQS